MYNIDWDGNYFEMPHMGKSKLRRQGESFISSICDEEAYLAAMLIIRNNWLRFITSENEYTSSIHTK